MEEKSLAVKRESAFRIGLLHTGSPFLDIEYADECRNELLKKLKELGHEIITDDHAVATRVKPSKQQRE